MTDVCDHENIEAVTLNVCDQVNFSYDLELDGSVECSLHGSGWRRRSCCDGEISEYLQKKLADLRTKVLVRLQGL